MVEVILIALWILVPELSVPVVKVRPSPFPVPALLTAKVEASASPVPVVRPVAERLRAFAVVIEFAVKLKALVVAAEEANVCRPVPEVN